MEHTQRLTDAELHKGQQPSHAATLAVSDTRAPGAATGAPGPRPSALVAATERVPREQLLFGATEPAIQPRGESLPRGTRIARYAIIERLGAGGFGVVYRAHDPQLDRDVALKLLHPGAGDSDARARLLREARAAAKIRHPNVVNIHDADEVDGRVFIAMELIDGVSLRAWMARARPWRDVLDVFLKAGDGLRAAHDVGLVHRDFKPDNVLIEHSGRVRVLDFGLARPAFSEDPRPESPDDAAADTLAAGASLDLMTSALTHSGLLLGTPAYMAPEQFHHRPLDARMDQFSFCVALYEGLFGARP
ncbi:MAG: serine/threonine protein kinase, partial [Myxococcales bacterium]|nr:serine/threonine protein kinase [Myxococcales bacterium]